MTIVILNASTIEIPCLQQAGSYRKLRYACFLIRNDKRR